MKYAVVVQDKTGARTDEIMVIKAANETQAYGWLGSFAQKMGWAISGHVHRVVEPYPDSSETTSAVRVVALNMLVRGLEHSQIADALAISHEEVDEYSVEHDRNQRRQ